MADLVKVLLLGTVAVALIGTILALPFMGFMSIPVFASAIQTLVNYAGAAFLFGRGLINNLLSVWGRAALTGLMAWILGKWFITYPIKIMVWIYHYLFK